MELHLRSNNSELYIGANNGLKNSVGIIPAAAIFVSQWAVVIIAAATWTNKNKGL